MRAPTNGLVRAGLVLAGAAGTFLLGGCGRPADPAPPPASPVAPVVPIAPTTAGTGGDGLTVRYLDHGTVRTLHVEDFPR